MKKIYRYVALLLMLLLLAEFAEKKDIPYEIIEENGEYF